MLLKENFQQFLLENLKVEDITLDFSNFGLPLNESSKGVLDYNLHSEKRTMDRIGEENFEQMKDFCMHLLKERFEQVKELVNRFVTDEILKNIPHKFILLRKKIDSTYYGIILLPTFNPTQHKDGLVYDLPYVFSVITVIVKHGKRIEAVHDSVNFPNTEKMRTAKTIDFVLEMRPSKSNDPELRKYNLLKLNKTIEMAKLSTSSYIS